MLEKQQNFGISTELNALLDILISINHNDDWKTFTSATFERDAA
jgi:hypothetical protein